MKFNGNIYSCQVLENWKTHEYTRFLHIISLGGYLQKILFYAFCGTYNYSTDKYIYI